MAITAHLEAIKALDGRKLASLSADELNVLRAWQRKRFNPREIWVHISYITANIDPWDYVRTKSDRHAQEMLRRSGAVISIHVYHP